MSAVCLQSVWCTFLVRIFEEVSWFWFDCEEIWSFDEGGEGFGTF